MKFIFLHETQFQVANQDTGIQIDNEENVDYKALVTKVIIQRVHKMFSFYSKLQFCNSKQMCEKLSTWGVETSNSNDNGYTKRM